MLDAPPRAAPLPATGPAYAYMLATTSASFQDLQAHYRQIATLSPTYYHVDRNLSISGQDDPLVTGWARLRGIAVEPRIETQDADDAARAARERCRTATRSSRASPRSSPTYGYDGVNIDFEAGPATRPPEPRGVRERALADAARAGRDADDGGGRDDQRHAHRPQRLLRPIRPSRPSATTSS